MAQGLLHLFMDVPGDRKRRKAELEDFKQRTAASEAARASTAIRLRDSDYAHNRFAERDMDERQVQDLEMKALTDDPSLHPAEATIVARQQLRDIKTNPNLAKAATTALSAQEAYGAMPQARELGATTAEAGVERNKLQIIGDALKQASLELRRKSLPEAELAQDFAARDVSKLASTEAQAAMDVGLPYATTGRDAAQASLERRLALDPETLEVERTKIAEQGVAARYGIDNPEHSRKFNPYGDIPSMEQWMIQNLMNRNRSNTGPTTATPDTGGVLMRRPRGITLP